MIIFHSGSSFIQEYPESLLPDPDIMSTFYEITHKLYHEHERFRNIISRVKKDRKVKENKQ